MHSHIFKIDAHNYQGRAKICTICGLSDTYYMATGEMIDCHPKAEVLASNSTPLLCGSGKNRYGLDAAYFVKEFAKLTRDIDNYTPMEMHRYLERLSDAAI